MDILKRILCVMYVMFLIFGATAQRNLSLPTSEQDSSLLAPLVYDKVLKMTADLTQEVAAKFSFCITDIEKERNDAFNFSSDSEFLVECLNTTEGDMLQHLCSVAEIKFYFNNYLGLLEGQSGNGKMNKNCNSMSWGPGCEPGWSSSTASAEVSIPDLRDSEEIPARTESSKPCCAGFFCPRGLTCMIPCPLGAYCPQARLNKSTSFCDPYDYQLPPGKENHPCGGADRWGDAKSTAEVFCSAGYYCPTTTEKKACSHGHYCRLGSTSERSILACG